MKHRTWFLVGVSSLVLSVPSFANLTELNKADVQKVQANAVVINNTQKGARVVVRAPVARTTTVVATPVAPTTAVVVKQPVVTTTTVVKTPAATVVRTPVPRARVRVVR